MQSIKSEAKIFLCVLLTTLRVKNQAISNNNLPYKSLLASVHILLWNQPFSEETECEGVLPPLRQTGYAGLIKYER